MGGNQLSKKISVKVVKNSKQQTERNTLLADTFENRWFQNEWKHKFKTLTSGGRKLVLNKSHQNDGFYYLIGVCIKTIVK